MNTTNKRITLYFILTLSITWLMWLPSVLIGLGHDIPTPLQIIGMPANFIPSIVAIILYKKEVGEENFSMKVKEKFTTKFDKKWLLIIPVYFALTAILGYFLLLMFEPDFTADPSIPLFMTPLVFLQIFFIGGALGEEFGWRGYAYPKLTKSTSILTATLILGLIWSLWHLPLHFMENTVQSNIPIWQFMLQNTMIAFYYTWLYQRVKGNLWLMIYLHAVANTAAAMVPTWQSETGRFIGFGVLAVGIIVLYLVFPIKKYIKNAN